MVNMGRMARGVVSGASRCVAPSQHTVCFSLGLCDAYLSGFQKRAIELEINLSSAKSLYRNSAISAADLWPQHNPYLPVDPSE